MTLFNPTFRIKDIQMDGKRKGESKGIGKQRIAQVSKSEFVRTVKADFTCLCAVCVYSCML